MRALLLSCFFLLPLYSGAQTADEIIQKYIRFIGGENKWKKVKTMVSKGDYDYGGAVFPFTTYAKAPRSYKFIVPFNDKFYAQGYDGSSGWKIDAFKNETKPTQLEGEAALAMANEADVELENPFINYNAKGHLVKLEGRDTLENKLYHKISLLRNNGQKETYYFDLTSYALHLKMATAKNAELDGALLYTYFSEYKDLKGMKMPFRLVSMVGDQIILTITVKEIMLNTEINDEEFKAIRLN